MNFRKEIFEYHEVRKTKLQKEQFRKYLIPKLRKMGYLAFEETSGSSTNIVVGEPKNAKYLLTAHYDTCAGVFFPNLCWPTNPFYYVIYNIIVAVGLIVAALVISIGLTFLLNLPQLTLPLYLILLIVFCILLMIGPANPHTANDNTSGVLTLLSIMEQLPAEMKKDVCFIFFDNEEKGLLGSKAYKKKHKKEIPTQICMNFDCVGDGEHMMILPNKYGRWNVPLIKALDVFVEDRGLIPHVKTQGLIFCPSDQVFCKTNVVFMACHKKRIMGYYCDKIHTKKDTVCEERNIQYLTDSMLHFLNEVLGD